MMMPPVKQKGRSAVLSWLKRFVIAMAVVATALQWVNSRVAIVWQKQNPSHNTVPTGYPAFHSMATGLHEGRIGQIDLPAMELYARLVGPGAAYERLPAGAEHHWVNFYTFDVGYSFIVEVARLLFPALPDNYLRALALQLVADAVTVTIVFFVFSQWNVALAALAAYFYSTNQVFGNLVAIPYYYYWDIPLTFVVLGAMLAAYRRPAEATRWLSLAAFGLGFGVWLRGSWWPLSLFLLAVAVCSRQLRAKLLIPTIVFAIAAIPQVARSSLARGQPTFTTRSVWHVALVGLGYYPNPYGLRVQDESVFELTREKYGVAFKYEDYFVHDQAAKKELTSIWQNDRGFMIRSFFGRLKESLAGSALTDVRSYESMSNITYRLACLVGLVAMVVRGGDKRLLGVAAAGMYAIYVFMTCVFYFVGLAYDNVTQVTLLILFMGGIEAALYGVQRALGPVAPPPRLA
jgi:hypothetical protein